MKKLLIIISIIISQSQIIYAQMFGGMMIIKKPNIIGTLGAINCAGATRSGNLVSNMLSNNVSIQIPYTGGNGGSYNGQIVNSTSITGLTATLTAGNFLNGSGTVTYSISGTPSGTGTANFAINVGGLTCSLSTAVSAPPSFNCAGTVINPNNWTLTNGSSYSGTISIPYTAVAATAGAAFPADTIISNGLMFVRPAGTYTSSGNIIYTISGVYTGATNTIFTITTNAFAGSCNIVIFDAIRGALQAAGCTNCSPYDAAAVNGWVNISAAEYTQVALLVGAGKYVANDTYMNGTPQSGFYDNGSGVSLTMATSGQTLVPANNFIVAFSIKTGGYTGAIASNLKLKRSLTSVSSGYSDEGSFVTSPSTSASNTRYYWVRKRPSATIGVSAAYIGCYHKGGSSMVGINNIGTNWSTNGDVSSFPGTSPYTPFIQVISTPTKQW
jgi:hypothetical protein